MEVTRLSRSHIAMFRKDFDSELQSVNAYTEEHKGNKITLRLMEIFQTSILTGF
jgi:hypothetical protein